MKKSSNKIEQLQIRVSPAEKALITRSAKAAGLSMSDWVLSQVLKKTSHQFRNLVTELTKNQENNSYVLAEINDFLSRLPAHELMEAVTYPPTTKLSPYVLNYLTAMIEQACYNKNIQLPDWCRTVQALPEPHFITEMKSLRMHLLLNSPPFFRNRNIFIDSSIGGRV